MGWRHIRSFVLAALIGVGVTAPSLLHAETDTEAREGLLPVTDYTGGWMSRRGITGDWNGARQKMADTGITYEVEWTQTAQGVVDGGRDSSWEYGGSFDQLLRIDWMRRGLIPGALFTLRAESRYGNSVNPNTGSFLSANTDSLAPLTTPLDEGVGITVTELNHAQFFSEHFGLLVGKIQTFDGDPNEFAGGRGRYQFMNMALVQNPALLLTVPYSTLAVGMVILPTDRISVTTLIMNRTDSSTTTGFSDFDDGTTWVTEGNFQYRLADLPGGANVGAVYSFNGDFRNLGKELILPPGQRGKRESDSWAFYGSAWQYLFARGERPSKINLLDGRPDLEGIGVFGRLGGADQDTNPIKWVGSIGLGGRGLIPCRGRDAYGFGYAYSDVQKPDAFLFRDALRNAHGIEAYYDLSITPAVDLTFDVQWAKVAVKRIDEPVSVGFRLNVRL